MSLIDSAYFIRYPDGSYEKGGIKKCAPSPVFAIPSYVYCRGGIDTTILVFIATEYVLYDTYKLRFKRGAADEAKINLKEVAEKKRLLGNRGQIKVFNSLRSQ